MAKVMWEKTSLVFTDFVQVAEVFLLIYKCHCVGQNIGNGLFLSNNGNEHTQCVGAYVY